MGDAAVAARRSGFLARADCKCRADPGLRFQRLPGSAAVMNSAHPAPPEPFVAAVRTGLWPSAQTSPNRLGAATRSR